MGENSMENQYRTIISENEEVRNGFIVTSNRKKVRNIELGLLLELNKICKKHNIRYYGFDGTLLGAIRHGGFIPWDDDMDFVMFRKDYEKFWEIAPKELPNHIKLYDYYGKFSKLMNIKTTALGKDNWRNKDFCGGINIDILPIDDASRFTFINRIKSKILNYLRSILLLQRGNLYISNNERFKNVCVGIVNLFLEVCKVKYSKIKEIYNKINKKVLFRGENVYYGRSTFMFYPKRCFHNVNEVMFENIRIYIPNGYNEILKIKYGNKYMEPIIYPGGHNCWYSIDKSYKDIIKTFDKKKSNEDNYNDCKDLFIL